MSEINNPPHPEGETNLTPQKSIGDSNSDKSFLSKKRLGFPKFETQYFAQKPTPNIVNLNMDNQNPSFSSINPTPSINMEISTKNDSETKNFNQSENKESIDKRKNLKKKYKLRDKNDLCQQLSHSLTHSSRYINKKDFFEDFCFICKEKKYDCISLTDKLDVVKSFTSLIIMRKSIKELEKEEMTSLDKNKEQFVNFLNQEITNVKFLDNNFYKGKYFCIQCLINLISSNDIFDSLNKIVDIKETRFDNLFGDINKKQLKLDKEINIIKRDTLISNCSKIEKDININLKHNLSIYKSLNKEEMFIKSNSDNIDTNNTNFLINSENINENNLLSKIQELDKMIKIAENNLISNKVQDNYNSINLLVEINNKIRNINFDLLKIHLRIVKIIQAILTINNYNQIYKDTIINSNLNNSNNNLNILFSQIIKNNKSNIENIIYLVKNEFNYIFERGLKSIQEIKKSIELFHSLIIKNNENKLFIFVKFLKDKNDENSNILMNSQKLILKLFGGTK